MLAQRLDFAPGSRFAYSNFGYVLLGRVIEKIGGQPYDSFVRKTLLDPYGLPRVQKGASLLAGRLPGEVKYYDYPGAPLISSYLSPAREKVPAPYGVSELRTARRRWLGRFGYRPGEVSRHAGRRASTRPRSAQTVSAG